MTSSQLDQGWICNVIPVLSTHCNLGALTFFTVTTFVRFFLFAMLKALPTERNLTQLDFMIGSVIIATSLAWIYGWTGRTYS